MKERITTVLVDQQYEFLEKFRALIGLHCPDLEIVAVARTANEAHGLIQELDPQLVILDFNMQGDTATDLLECFPERKFSMIATASNPERKITALKSGALEFLIKPIQLNALNGLGEKIRMARQDFGGNQVQEKLTSIALTHAGGFSVVDLMEVARLQADDNYTKVYTADGKRYMVSRPLKDFERRLPEDVFVRPHKSHMLNMFFLKKYLNEDGGIAVLKDGTRIPISKRKMSFFMAAVKRFSLVIRK
ncbi:MAG: LytR/AlgR family response regulator transcription factor [Bacteroidia bacterium]